MAKLNERPELTPQQRDACVSHFASRWDTYVVKCRGDRLPYAVSVALGFAREQGWLPRERNAKTAVAKLAQGRPCIRCQRLWFPGEGCMCPPGTPPTFE